MRHRQHYGGHVEVYQRNGTLRGVPHIITTVFCSSWAAAKLTFRGRSGLRAFVQARGLHLLGEGDMLILFIDPDREMFGAVFESDDAASPTLRWSADDKQAAIREALALLQTGRGVPAPAWRQQRR